MHFVFLNQFYPPDVLPTGVVLEAVAQALVAQGHVVTVVCARSSVGSRDPSGKGGKRPAQGGPSVPPEVSPGAAGSVPPLTEGGAESLRVNEIQVSAPPEVRIVRLRALGWGRKKSTMGKVLAYASYYAGVGWWILRHHHRADVIVALTTPPYLSVLARAFSKVRGRRHAHWVMDLYPDVMVAHGMIREGGFALRMLRGLTRWGFGGRRCVAAVTLGPDMAEKVQSYLPASRKASWVPLWGNATGQALPAEVAALRLARGWKTEEVVFLYSGNIGLGHRILDCITAAQSSDLKDQPIRLAFYGGGKRLPEVEAALRAWASGSSTLGGYVERELLATHLATGDVHLASLDPAWDGTMLPSKLQGIFAAGRPVLFTGSRSGDVGRWILESGAGWVCAPGDVAAHAAAMQEAMAPDVRERMGMAAREFAGKWFDKQVNVRKIADILAEVP